MIWLAAHSTSTSAWDEPGTLGFLVVFGMGVVLYFVFRSMAKQLRKVRQAAWLDEQAQKTSASEADGPQPDGSQPDGFADTALGRSAKNGPARRG